MRQIKSLGVALFDKVTRSVFRAAERHLMTTRNFDKLFRPASVALMGASARPDSLGRAVLENLRKGGFKGQIGLVNPRHQVIDGLPCSPSVADLPFIPDLAIVVAPKESAADLVAQAAARGVASALVITADPDHGANSLSARLRDISRATGIRVVGPNCLGVVAPRVGLDASFASMPTKAGDLAVISQSGAIAAALIAFVHERRIGFSALVSVGDMADVDFGDLLDWFALDSATRAILLYVEAIGDARKFMSAARAAARVKPVIVIKSGRHPRAASAAATHTGAMAGSDAVYEAAFRRSGLLRVRDVNELFDAAEALGRVRPFPGDRLAILTNGGGIGVLAVDDLLDLGGKLAELSPATREALDAAMPPTWSRANPADIVGDANPERYRVALEALLADPANDAVMVMHCPTAMSDGAEVAAAVAAAARAHNAAVLTPKPIFAVWLGASAASDRIFEEARIPHYQTGAVRGFMHLVHWRQARDALMATPPSLPETFAPDVAGARAIIAGALARGAQWLDPVEASDLLAAYGIPVAPVKLATDPREAAAIAEKIIAEYGACAIKIHSRDITHKSDIGGVVLNVMTPVTASAAAHGVLDRAARLSPGAHIDGVLIQPMVRRANGRELIVGVADDPTFGPVIMFGRGGKAVEAIGDRALALPPLDLALARALIARTRASRQLAKYRDVPAADIDAVALTLVKLAQLSADIEEIREIDINPLIADETGVIAVDSRVLIAPVVGKRSPVNPRFAIAPYPKDWERWITRTDGTRVLCRPVRPDDEDMYRRFFQRVTIEDLRLRFFAPVREFSHAFIARLTQVDYARSFVLCAIEEGSGDMLGAVRLMMDANFDSGEYAILMRSDQKGRGLGWSLMKMMIDYARSRGLKRVEGQVLGENTNMLAMCGKLGFRIVDEPDDPGVKMVSLDLTKGD